MTRRGTVFVAALGFVLGCAWGAVYVALNPDQNATWFIPLAGLVAASVWGVISYSWELR